MGLLGIDHVEIYVADLEEAVEHFRAGYGFCVTAATGEAGADRRSLLLTQGTARLVLTTGLGGGSEVNDFVAAHGDGVRNIALRVPDAAAAFAEAVQGGATALRPPSADGDVVLATVQGVETVTHTFVERRAGEGLLPGFRAVGRPVPGAALIHGIDHLAICLPPGTMAAAEDFYLRALGLRRSFTEYVEFGEQAMESVVIGGGPAGQVTFTLVAPDCREGQLVDFLDSFGAGGVQHIAFLTGRIAEAVPALGERGVRFLSTPAGYYDALPARLGHTADETRALAALGVLVDRDPWGDLLQIFTRSPFPRDTLFFELIERRKARTFGSANIRALYEAAEHERADRLVGAGGDSR